MLFTNTIQHIAPCWCYKIMFICLHEVKLFVSRPQHCTPYVGCNMSGRKSQCCLETPPQSPCLQLNQSLRNRVFHLQSIWNWGNQPDVQSCLLKHSPCLGFGSWTDSQPCGMAAVEGLFKLHPG